MSDATLARLSSRKFILAIFAVCVAAVLCAAGHVDGSGFVTVVLAALAIYSSANVIQKKVAADGGAQDA